MVAKRVRREGEADGVEALDDGAEMAARHAARAASLSRRLDVATAASAAARTTADAAAASSPSAAVSAAAAARRMSVRGESWDFEGGVGVRTDDAAGAGKGSDAAARASG